jgi:outer membrane protein
MPLFFVHRTRGRRSARQLHTLLLASCLLVGPRAFAQDSAANPSSATPRVLSLPEAIAFAHEHQPSIRAALARLASVKAEAKVPRAAWQPVVGASAQIYAATANNTTGAYLGVGDLALPRIGGTRDVSSSSATWKPYASTLVGLGATQEVFDFGRIAANAAAADAQVEVGKSSADAVRLDLDLGVEEAYFGVYAAKGVLAASKEAYTSTKEHRDLAKAGVASGLRSPIELTRAEADLSRYEIGVIRAQGGLDVAQVVLAAAVGAPDTAFDVSGAAPTPAELPSLADGVRMASERDPVLREALARLKAQEKATTAISASLRPNLFATGTISGRAGGAAPSGNGDSPTGSGFLPDVPNWDVGLVLSWTLFDGVTLARRDASRAAEREREEEILLYRQREVAAVEEAYVRVAAAKGALPALESAVAGATANYKQADARFRAGLGNSVELADAEQLRASAEIQLALGLFEVARTRAEFGRAIAEGL